MSVADPTTVRDQTSALSGRGVNRFDPLFGRLRERWLALLPRERRLVAFAVCVLAIFLLDQLAISPAWQGSLRLERELPQRRFQLAQMDAVASEFSTLATQAAAPAAAPLRVEIEKALKLGQIEAELPPAAEGSAQELRIKKVQITQLLNWLATTQRDLRVRASSVEIERTPTAEFVAARVRFERPAIEPIAAAQPVPKSAPGGSTR